MIFSRHIISLSSKEQAHAELPQGGKSTKINNHVTSRVERYHMGPGEGLYKGSGTI